METIEFSYRFDDEGDNKEVFVRKEHDCIGADECCEMFLEFMTSAGYMRESVEKFFKTYFDEE